MKMLGSVWAVGVCLACVAGAAAKNDRTPQPAPELRAAGPAKEIPVNREATGCRIEVVAGTVVINTVVVRAGRDKLPVTVVRSMQAGESADVAFGPRRLVSGLRISDGGGGTYRVVICDEPPPERTPPERTPPTRTPPAQPTRP